MHQLLSTPLAAGFAGLHGFVLLITDLAGIAVGGMAAYHLTGLANQVWLQVPIAVAATVFAFSAWILLLRVCGLKRFQRGSAQFGLCLGFSLLWGPLIFVPLHYFTQGYLTSIGNLMALAFYQVPANVLALAVASIFQRARSGKGAPEDVTKSGGPNC